ncbi:hypothetical protein H696_01924 [Fonticula alba]|uniref:Serine/threonine protein kinase n=1 Tax=Fonticula alba TaxID=691883 RepID=A0A058ZC20_FONAL|nr:hypothetical protein H696_01924 [Fonticula alba]KCV70977.1 hypothetical protein H696_01924 [Fonticula alba]|eukprot:XP_009494100.1 hypothetical protein H696_01924 [Fonticula alba]
MTLRRVMMALVALVALSAGALRAQSILPTTATTCAQGALSFSSRPVDTVPSLVSSQPLVLLRGVTDMSTIDSPTYQADFTGSNQGTQLAANLIQSQVLLFQQASLDTQLNPDHRWGSSFGYSTLVFGNTQTIGQEVQLLPTYDSSPAFMLRTNSDLTITHDSRALSYGPGLWPVAISFRSSDPFLVARDASGQHRLVEYDNGSPRTFAIEAPLTAAGHFRAGAGRVIFAWVNSALYTVTRGSSGSLDLVLQAMPSCQIVDFAATRVLATSARREDVLVLFDDRSFLVLLNFDEEIDSDTAVYAGTLPAEVSNDGRIVHVPSTDTRSPVGWVLYLDHSPPSAAGATVPGAADARVTSRPALWRVSFGSPITWQPVALPSSSDATTVQAFFSGSLNQWIMTDGLRGLYTPEQFKCAVDHSITCDPMVPGRLGATSPEGWTCIPGQVLSPMRLPNRLCSGCPAGYFLQPDGQDPNVFECVACPSGCDACIGDTCLACGGDLLLLTEGQTTRCVATCPEGTRAGMDHCMGETAKPAIQFQLQPATPPADVTLSIVGLARTSIMVKEGVLHLPMAFPPAEYHYFAMLSTGQVAWFNGRDIEPVGSTSDVEPLPLVWAPLPHATTTSLVELGPFNHEGAQVLVLFSCSQNSLFYTILRCGIGGQGASCPSASSSPILLSSGACYNIRAFDERRVTAYLGQYVAFEVKDDTGQVSIQTINVLPTVPQAGPPVPALGPDPAPPGNQAVWSILGDSMGALYLAPLTVVGQRDPRFAWRPMVTAPHGFSVLNLATGHGDPAFETVWTGMTGQSTSTFWEARYGPLGTRPHGRTSDLHEIRQRVLFRSFSVLNLATGHGDPAFETVWTGMTGQSTSTFWEARYGPLGTRPHGRTSDLHEIRHRLFEVPPAVQLGGIFALTLGLPDFPSALLLLLSNQVVVSMFHCPAGGAALCRLLPGVSVPLPINFSSFHCPAGGAALCRLLPGVSVPLPINFSSTVSAMTIVPFSGAPPGAGALDGASGPSVSFLLACSGQQVLRMDLAVAPCPAGRFGSLCQPCHASCLDECTGPGPEDCLACRAWHIHQPGVCLVECPPDTTPLPHRGCTPCSGVCDTCGLIPSLDRHMCTACPDMFFLEVDPAAAPTPAGVCLPCHFSCHTCTGPTGADCLTCPAGMPWHENRCVTSCPPGFWNDQASSSCLACPTGCASCLSPVKCTNCRVGFFPNGSGACAPCDASCHTCAGGAGACTACRPGLVFLDADPNEASICGSTCAAGDFLPAAANRCAACDPSCALCSGSKDNCTVCAAGHRWASGTVGPGECVACGSGCRTCTATRCLTCAAGQWLTPEGTCQPGCPAGWFADAGTVDGTGAGGGECQMCDVECAECDQSAGHCTAP